MKGSGNSINYTYRMHDPRLGRFFAVDPIDDKYPELTPYQFSSNRLVDYVELEGLEGVKETDHGKQTTTIRVTFVYYTTQTGKNEEGALSLEQAKSIREGIMGEFKKGSFQDQNGYNVSLQISLEEKTTRREAQTEVRADLNGSYPSKILLKKVPIKEVALADGAVGRRKGYSFTGFLGVADFEDTHNQTHELWHDLFHNHPNAPAEVKYAISRLTAEKDHYNAGGIWIYANIPKGITREDLNQKNVSDVLRVLPETGNDFLRSQICTENCGGAGPVTNEADLNLGTEVKL